MSNAACSDSEFIELFERLGAANTAKRLKISVRNVFARRQNLERIHNREIKAPDPPKSQHEPQIETEIDTGIVLIGSDAHYWPGIISTAHRAFVKFCKEMKPTIVVKNGDALDGASISRHPRIGWEQRPQLIDEIEACKERLDEIVRAAKGARLYWPLGNHDSRFETRLANVAPEYARVHGVHLKDHFPEWLGCWSLLINDDVVVKHRFKSGIHAHHNNALWSGRTIFTGHLHKLGVAAISDYNGTRWGVDSGTMADPTGPQFEDYTEKSPTNWRQGFVVATFHKGRLLWPEIVHVIDTDHVEFRGRVVAV